ncbi:MAG: hypothetical protein ACFFDS_07945 [Candidatus Thorarchaeota archaeon]
MSTILNESIKPIIKKLLEEAWDVRDKEKILIISDYPSAEDFTQKPLDLMESMVSRNILAKKIYEIIQSFGRNHVELYNMKPTYEHYKNPEDSVLKEKINNVDIVLSLTEYSLTDVPIVTEPLEKGQLRHISAPLVPVDIFYPNGPLDVDYYKMEEITTKLFSLVQGAKKVEVFDVAGSHLILEFLEPIDWLWESGFANEKGMFSNLPAGEITLMLDYNQRNCLISGNLRIFPGWIDELTQLLSLSFNDNRLVDVAGGGKAGEYLQDLIINENVPIVQLGIGTNPNAKDPLCPTVADKFIGMAHIRMQPDERIDHYYLPISKMKINDKEYSRPELFE